MTAFTLRHWSDADRDAFAALHADAAVMADLGGPIGRAASDAKFDAYRRAWDRDGIGRWAVTSADGAFVGYTGVMARGPDHPLRCHHEIGWRLRREVWGQGLASGSARLALERAWPAIAADEIVSYTAAHNLRSRAVMARLGLVRDVARDFTMHYANGPWRGLVWVARRPS